MHIGIDLMGGDYPPEQLAKGVKQAATSAGRAISFLLFYHERSHKTLIDMFADLPQVQLVPCSDEVTMQDSPLEAVRRKRDSSMLTAIHQLKEGELDAVVSVGSTGALVAASTILLKRIPAVSRPALLALLPTDQRTIAVLDVGGMVSVQAIHLFQYALMGCAFQRSLGVKEPRVALLNIGAESLKGTSQVQEAFQLLQDSPLHFIGNVEGRDVFNEAVDVLVTDGFTGNVFLKTAEGVSRHILERISSSYQAGQQETLQKLMKQVDYEEYPGAMLCGINGIVVKCHGSASERGLYHSIEGAVKLVENRVVHSLATDLAENL